jgi:hypothetical protein
MDNALLSRLYLLLNEVQSELRSYELVDLNLYHQIIEGRKNNISNDFQILNTLFPSLTKEELANLLLFFKMLTTQYNQDKVDLVGTLPIPSPNVRKTVGVVRQLVNEANNHILLTGYAISEFFNDIFELVLMKNTQGVQVDLYVDDNQQVASFLNQFKPNEHQVRIYRYQGKETFSSLHAKVMVVDYQKAFVSSANLSYNGIVNNLELGTLIEGKKVTVINQIFNELLSKGYFKRI